MPCCSSPAKLSSPYSAVATLLLIENSASMCAVWRILRDQYLPSVLGHLQGTTPGASPPAFFIESSSLSPGIAVPPQFKVYSGALEFESDAISRLSPDKINSSIDLLNNIAIQMQPIELHLIIVAASSPASNYQNTNSNYFQVTPRSTWLQLAERMTQDNVQCHLVLKTDQDISPFEILFEETLRLRTSREAPLPFNIKPTEAIIRLAETIGFAQTVAQTNGYFHRSHQRDPSNGKSHGSSQAQCDAPTLVAELQQRHGLNKKKVYGVKTPRQPFFQDEPLSDPHRRHVYPLPTPLTDLSLTTPTTMTPGGRSAPLSRLDRLTRMGRRGLTDASRRWQQPASKMPSSGVGSSVAPSSMVSNEPAVIQRCQAPVQTPTEIPYQAASHLDQNGFYHPATYEQSINSQWGMTPSSYIPENASVITQTPQAAYIQNVRADTYSQLQTPASLVSSQSPPEPAIDHNPSGLFSNDATPLNYDVSAPSSSSTSSPSPKAVSTPKDDEPFTFSPAFIAATTVMFRQEVLPDYPDLVDSYVTSMKRKPNGSAQGACDHSILPYLPASKAGQLYAARYSVAACQPSEANPSSLTTPENTTTVNTEAHYYQFPTYSVGTSSLTGWAG